MVRTSKVAPCLFVAAVVMSLLSMGLEASNPADIDHLFQSIDRQDLNSSQRIAMRALRNRFLEERVQNSRKVAEGSRQFVNEFLLCASGVLDDQQFQLAIGVAKNPRQQLRYEIRQLHAEIVRLEGILRQLNR
ncbi:MAG: hypothetical protein VX764_02620 [Planctomycetota bacterium]|nr:hypothetical protein [Planctomycetota bacterium]